MLGAIKNTKFSNHREQVWKLGVFIYSFPLWIYVSVCVFKPPIKKLFVTFFHIQQIEDKKWDRFKHHLYVY